jgi:hypothetical protein
MTVNEAGIQTGVMACDPAGNELRTRGMSLKHAAYFQPVVFAGTRRKAGLLSWGSLAR